MIRAARKEDSPSLLGITAAAGSFTPAERECVAALWTSYREQGIGSGYEFLVYCDERERVLGYACFGQHPLTEGTYDLYWIAVLPEASGHGIGRALIAEVEQEVRARGGRLLLIETSDTPPYGPARRLYESCGCTAEATIGGFYAPADSLVIFVKRLS
jgi:ribosomal protein S18 acetylase RimI-like enzyme